MRLGQLTMAMCQYSKKCLEKDNSVTIHEGNLRILVTELNKTKENLAAPIMHEERKRGISNITSAHKLTFIQVCKNSQLWLKGTQIQKYGT